MGILNAILLLAVLVCAVGVSLTKNLLSAVIIFMTQSLVMCIIWILLETTQGKTHPISPVTALWIIAIPLMDMVAIMYRRLRKGMSPFSPDRQHIHHLIMRAGFTSRQAFVLITLAAALLALVGVVAEYTRIVPEWVMLILFLLAFFLYGYCIKRAWKVARLVKRIRRRIRRHSGNNPKLTK